MDAESDDCLNSFDDSMLPPRKKRKLTTSDHHKTSTKVTKGKIVQGYSPKTKGKNISFEFQCIATRDECDELIKQSSNTVESITNILCKVNNLLNLMEYECNRNENEDEMLLQQRRCLDICQNIVENLVKLQTKLIDEHNEEEEEENDNIVNMNRKLTINYDIYLKLSFIYLKNGNLLPGVRFCNAILKARYTKGWSCDYGDSDANDSDDNDDSDDDNSDSDSDKDSNKNSSDSNDSDDSDDSKHNKNNGTHDESPSKSLSESQSSLLTETESDGDIEVNGKNININGNSIRNKSDNKVTGANGHGKTNRHSDKPRHKHKEKNIGSKEKEHVINGRSKKKRQREQEEQSDSDSKDNTKSSKNNINININEFTTPKKSQRQPTLTQVWSQSPQFGTPWRAKRHHRRLRKPPRKIVVKRGISKEVSIRLSECMGYNGKKSKKLSNLSDSNDSDNSDDNDNNDNNNNNNNGYKHKHRDLLPLFTASETNINKMKSISSVVSTASNSNLNSNSNDNVSANANDVNDEYAFIDELDTLDDMPLKCEIAIRSNLGLMCLRCAMYSDAMFEIDTMTELKEMLIKQDKKYENIYDPFGDYIRAIILYNQSHYKECVNVIEFIFKTIKQQEKTVETENLIHLDKYGKYELTCMLADCYCKINEFSKAKKVFCDKLINDKINKTIISQNNVFFWQVYINFLQNIGEIDKAYKQCVYLLNKNPKFRFNSIFTSLLNQVSIVKNIDELQLASDGISTVIDAQYVGNQCRFVNDGDAPNCEFLIRYDIGSSTYPIQSEVWLKTLTKEACYANMRYYLNEIKYKSKIDKFGKDGVKLCAHKEYYNYKRYHMNFALLKGEELCVSYGNEYWENVNQNGTKLLSVNERNNDPWDNVIFSHMILDCSNISDIYNPNSNHNNLINLQNKIKICHLNNPRLGDKNYPNCIEIRPDKHGGFGCFATKNIRHKQYLLRYAGVKRFATHNDMSQSRYAITLAKYQNVKNQKLQRGNTHSKKETAKKDV